MEGKSYHIHAELVARCRRGERKAQNEIYRLYSGAMYNTCLRMMRDEAEAADALQDAFLSAFGSLHQFEASASFGAWLKRVVVNHCINHLRKRRLEMQPIEEHHQDLQPEGEPDWQEQELQVNRIKDAMGKLPEGFKQVFSLYMFEGYSHSEIAEMMGITESTSKSQLNRAKKKIKELI